MKIQKNRALTLLIILELALGVVGLIWMSFSSVSSPAWLLPAFNDLSFIAAGAVLGALIAGAMMVAIKFSPSLARLLPDHVVRFLQNLHWWQAALVALAAGIGEEILFRGALQPSFGLIPASLLFGLMHPVNALYIAVAAVMGFVLGSAFALSDSLYLVITAHATYDLIMIEKVRRSLKEDQLPEAMPELEYPEEYPED
jgi:membrane protease YdiL (CAAX protease family)